MSVLRPEPSGHRLLLVEDDRHNIDDLRDAFGDLGYECEVALDLNTAHSILAERRMAVVVVNAEVPEEKDEKLIEELKAIAPGMRLIVYNGTRAKARQRKLRRMGAYSYLSTASDINAVVRSVQRAFEE
jgi:DNA-binding NtrC family response regulator